MSLLVRPTTITEAKKYNAAHHRHNALPPVSGLFASGVEANGELVGVAIAGRPSARPLDDGWTVEVTRNATDGTRNACSMLYGSITRAAKALGYRRAYTYTLDNDTETGASLRASGWVIDAHLPARAEWKRSNGAARYQTDLFGNERRPPGPKIRWRRDLALAGSSPTQEDR